MSSTILSIVNKPSNNSYFFSNYKSINNGIIINNVHQLKSISINFNNIKRFLFIGYLDKISIKTINKLVNLEDIQLQFYNQINYNIELNLTKLKYLTIQFPNEYKFKLIYKNDNQLLKMICTNLSSGLKISYTGSIENAYYLCKRDIDKIINLKNLKILQIDNEINTELINSIGKSLNHLDKLILTSSKQINQENINKLIQIIEKYDNLTITIKSIKLNKNVKIDSTKNDLENQIINFDYLDEYADLPEHTINYNNYLNYSRELKEFNHFFYHYKSITTIKLSLDSNINLKDLNAFLLNVINLNALKITIDTNQNYSNELIELIDGLENKLVNLEIRNIENNCPFDLISVFDKLDIISSFETNMIIQNADLKRFKNFDQLEILEFRRKIKNKSTKIHICACDAGDGRDIFCLYLDDKCKSQQEQINDLIDYVIKNLN